MQLDDLQRHIDVFRAKYPAFKNPRVIIDGSDNLMAVLQSGAPLSQVSGDHSTMGRGTGHRTVLISPLEQL